ncbi:MAG TPA: lipocalin family protein [Edaphocola sp.]|nr:lipocalin family protein [Edaphocola sp.]
MKLKNNLLLAAGCGLLLLASCQNPKEQIIGKWQVESFESPAADSMAKVRTKAIDTITKVDSSMAAFMGTYDLDSIKSVLKSHVEDYKQQQKDMAALTSLAFFKDGLAVFYSGPQSDTNKWSIAGKDKLVLSPFSEAQRQAGAKEDTAIIESISKGKLRLKINQGKNFMYANLRTFTKEDSAKANEVLQKQQQMMQEQIQKMQQMQQAQAANKKS